MRKTKRNTRSIKKQRGGGKILAKLYNTNKEINCNEKYIHVLVFTILETLGGKRKNAYKNLMSQLEETPDQFKTALIGNLKKNLKALEQCTDDKELEELKYAQHSYLPRRECCKLPSDYYNILYNMLLSIVVRETFDIFIPKSYEHNMKSICNMENTKKQLKNIESKYTSKKPPLDLEEQNKDKVKKIVDIFQQVPRNEEFDKVFHKI